MTQLDITDGFSIHDYRRGLKLIKDDGQSRHLENREDLGCPACGKPFETLFVSEKRTATFGNPGKPFCLARTDGKLLVLTH
jgi:hypothetical protein